MGKGQLLFKGDKPKKKKHKSKHSTSSKDDDEGNISPPANAPVMTINRPMAAPAASAPAAAAPSMKKGTGTITTSGTVVTGYDTRFEKELNAGDAILCVVDNGKEELRVITMRLSNVSLNLSSPFSTDLKTPASFHYIRKPRDVQKERVEAQKRQAESLQDQKTHAFDLYGNEALVYREKTETGSYRIKREEVKTQSGAARSTRGDLLEMRAKKTSDKYC